MGDLLCSVLSRDEMIEAIRALSDASWNRLRRVATMFSRGRPIEPEDLLQEALARATNGSRNCPRNIDIVRFLAEAMRSIASSSMKVIARQLEVQAVPLIGDDGVTLDLVDERPTAEQQAISDQEVARIKQAIIELFCDDVTAQVLVEGMMEGSDGEELRATTDLTKVGLHQSGASYVAALKKPFPMGGSHDRIRKQRS